MQPEAPGAEDMMARLRNDELMVAQQMVERQVPVRQVARKGWASPSWTSGCLQIGYRKALRNAHIPPS